jgi:gliding-associated putative ABC transporter substrate-binding component GldG
MKFDLKRSFFLPVGLLLLVLILVNLISRNWFFRWDLTDNKMYSLSESSRTVVKQIDDLLTMKVYFSDNLPGEYGNNRRYLQDILEEYAAYSHGNIRFEFYTPESDEDLEAEAQKAGITPVQLQVVENDKLEVKRIFMGMVMLYEDKKEVIPVIQTTTGLEYEITTGIKKLVEKNRPQIGLVNRNNSLEAQRDVMTLLSQRYRVLPVDLSNDIPESIQVLFMSGITDSLQAEERDHLIAFLQRGGNLFLTQNRVATDLQNQEAHLIQSDIFDLLKTWGFTVEENLVLDRICGRVNVMQNMGFIRMNVPMEYPLIPIIRTFNQEEPLVSGLEEIQLLFPSEIQADTTTQDTLIHFVPLMYTSDHSGVMKGYFNMSPDPKMNPVLRRLNQKRKLVAARVELTQPETGVVSQIIFVADSQFLLDEGGGMSPENHVFVMNAADYLLGDRELIALRSREITSRPLAEISDREKQTWKWINIVLPSLLIVIFGFVRMRQQKRRAKWLEELYD